MKKLALSLLLALGLCGPGSAAPKLTQTQNPDGSTTYRIDQPTVDAASTIYPRVVLRRGDLVRISAGGCVQTGGHGKTWRRFVAPTGTDAERLYSGTIDINGAQPAPHGRLAEWIGVPFGIVADTGTVAVGYEDLNYGDNGYANPDAGLGDQCLGQPPAWIAFNVTQGAPPTLGDPRYDEVAGKGAHNAYQRDESFPDMLGFHHLRSLEIDIHDSEEHDHWPELTRDRYVYHNVAHFGGTFSHTQSSCRKLTDCLHLLRAYHQAVPAHEVITVVIDLKDAFRSQQQQSPEDFESVVLATLGATRGNFYTPADLAASCRAGDPAAGAEACHWPRLSELRGKWILVLTGDDYLSSYLQCGSGGATACAAQRLGFVAPTLSAEAQIAEHPEARIFNLDAADSSALSFGGALRLRGDIGRGFDLSTTKGWSAALANDVELLATDAINSSPPTPLTTANAQGWPFTCLRADCSRRAADQTTLGIKVASGDIGGRVDDFMLAETRKVVTQVQGFVFAPSSSVDDQAKACFMSREAPTRGSPYFAVCRAAEKHAPSIQYRLNEGDEAQRIEILPQAFLPGADVSAASIAALRLVVSRAGRCYTGQASIDAADWRMIGRTVCFAAPLAHTGLAVSSHNDRSAVSFDLVGMKFDGVPAKQADLLRPISIGDVRQAAIADQPF